MLDPADKYLSASERRMIAIADVVFVVVLFVLVLVSGGG